MVPELGNSFGRKASLNTAFSAPGTEVQAAQILLRRESLPAKGAEVVHTEGSVVQKGRA